MSGTVAYPEIRAFAKVFGTLYRTAVFAGIVGDQAHQRRGGYHIGRRFQPSNNYSVIRPDDRSGHGPDDAATGVDMTMARADMILCTKRLKALYDNRNDPRRKYLNAFNGYLGGGKATRFDFVAQKTKVATPDHKTHVHIEFRRAYARVSAAYRAILSALRGETVAQYLASVGVKLSAAVKSAAAGAKPAARAATAPPWPGRTLMRTTAAKPDLAVKLWQERMIARGYKSLGAADGKFGPKTEAVVRLFQRACRVQVDGKIGKVTWPLPWTRPLG